MVDRGQRIDGILNFDDLLQKPEIEDVAVAHPDQHHQRLRPAIAPLVMIVELDVGMLGGKKVLEPGRRLDVRRIPRHEGGDQKQCNPDGAAIFEDEIADP